MKSFYTLLILLIPFFGFGQGWELCDEIENRQYGNSIVETNDGNYVMCGTNYNGNTNIFGDSEKNLYVVKVDPSGNIIYKKDYYGGSIENQVSRGIHINKTSDGGYIVAGTTNITTQTDPYLTVDNLCLFIIKMDIDGNEEWRIMDEDLKYFNNNIQQTNDGGYIVSIGRDLLKLSELGEYEWYSEGDSEFRGKFVEQKSDGTYVHYGNETTYTGIDPTNESEKLHLNFYDSEGNQLNLGYNVGYGIPYYGTGFGSGKTTNDNGNILFGTRYDDNDFMLVIYKLLSDGGILWVKEIIQPSSVNSKKEIIQTNDGGYLMCWTASNTENDSYFTKGVFLKLDQTGSEEWIQEIDYFQSRESLNSVIESSDGGFVFVGTKQFVESSDGFNDDNIFIVKTNSQGNITSTTEIPLPNPNRKLEKTINLQGQEVKPQTNQPVIELYNDGSVEKKLIIE